MSSPWLWMVYALAVSALVTAAAAAAEAALRSAGRSTRWAWAGALAASVALPLALPLLPVWRPEPLAVAAGVVWLDPLTVDFAPPVEPAWWSSPFVLWALASAVCLLLLGASHVGLARERRRWRETELAGERVLVSRGLGPAVVGLFPSRIVLPPWVLDLGREELSLVLLHEREHVRAGDPRLLLAALLGAAAVPWNPFLWVQLGRLRQCVETDCDRRVLARGGGGRAYGRLLLEVGRRRSPRLLLAAALSEQGSSLERRIRLIVQGTGRRRLGRALLLGTASIGLGALACWAPDPGGLVGPTGGEDGIDRVATVEDAARARLWEAPTFTPYTVRPDIVNRAEIAGAMEREYPPGMRELGIGGTVALWFFVDEEGRVDRTLVRTSSGNPALDSAALRVGRVIEFSPARNGDAVVPVWISLPITFRPASAPDRREVTGQGAGARGGAPAEPAPTATEQGAAGNVQDAVARLREEGPGRAGPALRGEERGAAGASPLGSAANPRFTPYTRRPDVRNRLEVAEALNASYPPLLRDAGIGGTVGVWFYIDETGTVTDTRIDTSSGHPALDRAALEVARVLRFSPALNRDQAVPVWISMPITFQP